MVQEAREEYSHHLKLLDHEMGLSFASSFDFALSTLLYRGFHHSNSATRLQTLRLFCLLYSSHTASEERLSCFVKCSDSNFSCHLMTTHIIASYL